LTKIPISIADGLTGNFFLYNRFRLLKIFRGLLYDILEIVFALTGRVNSHSLPYKLAPRILLGMNQPGGSGCGLIEQWRTPMMEIVSNLQVAKLFQPFALFHKTTIRVHIEIIMYIDNLVNPVSGI
jgi:hypothetical protein